MERSNKSRPFFTNIECHPHMALTTQEVTESSKKNLPLIDHMNYVKKILEYISKESQHCVSVKFICSDDQQVLIPLLLMHLALPKICRMFDKTMWYHVQEYTVFVPIPSCVLELLREIIVSGVVTASVDDEQMLSGLLEILGVNMHLRKDFDTHDTSEDENEHFIAEELSEDEEGELPAMSLKDIEINNINQGWKELQYLKNGFKNNTCSKFCPYRCYQITDSWSTSKLSTVKEMFQGENYQIVKTKLLNHLQVQAHVGRPTRTYFIYEQEFCFDHLSLISDCSVNMLKNVLNDFRRGVKLYQHGNRGIMKSQSSATAGFIAWFVNFLSLYGQEPPNKSGLILSYWLKGKTLYSMYVSECPTPHISLSTFYKHMKTYFGPRRVDPSLPLVTISKYSSHSVCSICVALNMNQKLCKSEAELNMVKSLRNQHKIDVGEARRTIEMKRQLAIDFPDDYLFLQFDGMGSYNSLIPRYLDNSKNLVGTERLPSKITGCILWNGRYQEKRKDIFWVNHEQYG